MKPEIKLFVKFQFTSLSPDSEPISLGIVSETADFRKGFNTANLELTSKSFYAEFTDFNIEKCDAWVKENVVRKLKILQTTKEFGFSAKNSLEMLNRIVGCVEKVENNATATGSISLVKSELKDFIAQFSDYNIQFVCDCGTFDWYWMLQLLAEWETYNIEEKQCSKCGWIDEGGYNTNFTYKTGLPKLPENISPVQQDLNDLIALKKGISVREAFDWNRLVFYFGLISGHSDSKKYEQAEKEIENNHNALFDAKVIKAIYEKLK